MITTFFGAHSFGGDAAYVDRLSQALCRRGHEVHVYHCVDAFNAVRGDHPLRSYTPPPGLHLHPLESRAGILSPLATQTTGFPFFKTAELREALDDPETDVVHFHNISLVGGPGVLGLGTNHRAVRIMTAHEHWLICPMHLLWKFDRKSCDGANCNICCLKGRRPPQLWRAGSAIERGLRNLDALIFPSRHALEEHRRRGLGAHVPMVHVPYFLPDGWSGGIEAQAPELLERPYIAAAGRLVKMKGFQRLIPLMAYLPEVDLRIAGTGPYEPALRALAHRLPNVKFEGLLGGPALASLFRSARAVVVPSLFPETFGYVVLEAFAVGTPVVVHEGGGALHETGCASGGGLGYRTDSELLTALRRMVHDRALHDELAAGGFAMRMGPWSETAHLEAYFKLVGQAQAIRERKPFPRPHSFDRRQPAPPREVSLPSRRLDHDDVKSGGMNRPHGTI
jgi:glycosyltransferase involved in cell wall biosynthesis